MKLLNLCIAILCFSLTSCMTMDTLSESKENFKEGKYVTGTFTGLLGLTIMPIADVFTLGGTLSADEATGVWTGAANTYNQNGNYNQSIQNNDCNSIRRNTPTNATQACQCEKGRVSQKNNTIYCTHTAPKSSWSCSYFDGRRQCATQ